MNPERTCIKTRYITFAMRNREQALGHKRLRRQSTDQNTEKVGNLFPFTVFIWKKKGITININVIRDVMVPFSTLHDWLSDVHV